MQYAVNVTENSSVKESNALWFIQRITTHIESYKTLLNIFKQKCNIKSHLKYIKK